MRSRLLAGVFVVLAALLVMVPLALAFTTEEFEASEFPATLSGKQEGEAVFNTEAGKVTCKAGSLSGSESEVSETLEVSPSFSECTAFGVAATVTPEGCHFALHGKEESGEAEFTGTSDITCPAGKTIKIAALTCAAEVGPQTGLSKVTYADASETFPETFTFKPNLTNIKYTVTKDGALCPFNGTGAKEGGGFSESVLFTGTNGGGEQVGVQVGPVVTMPAPLKFTGANESKVGGFYFRGPREYEIISQTLGGNAVYSLTATSEEACPGVFKVIAGEQKACLYTVKGVGVAMGNAATVTTVWRPKGGFFNRTTRVRIIR